MTMLIAHRGLSAEHPENSVAAVSAALTHVHTVEIDVRCSADLVPVCTHDGSLARTHGVDARVVDRTAAQLRREAPGLATLAELLDIVADEDAAVMLDVKVADRASIDAICAVVRASRITWNDGRQVRRGEYLDARTATFQSADPQLLRSVRARTGAGCLELVRGGSTTRQLLVGAPFITTYAQGVTLPESLAAPRTIRVLHALRLGSYAYTVNDAPRMRELSAAGVDGIYTDRCNAVP